MALEAGNVGIDQWPENPVRLAAWLADANWSVVRVLKHCDQGFRNPRVLPKSLLEIAPKNIFLRTGSSI